MNFKPLKGVMIGAGRFARFHAEAWRRLEGAGIVAVADTDQGRVEEFSEKFEIARAYRDAEEMLDRERPDFVDVVTPPDTHLKLVRLAANFGASVICQKPMAPSLEKCATMVAICAGAKVRLFIHENWRWQPWYREIKLLLDQGIIGNPYYAAFVMRNSDGRGPEPYPGQPYFRDMERLLVYEMAVHFIDVFRYLLGEFTSVFCRTERVNKAIKGEDFALIHFDFENGASGLIDANRISGPPKRESISEELIVEGDCGKIRVARDCRIFLDEYKAGEKALDRSFPTEGYRGDSVFSAQRHFISCLQTGKACETEGEDYLKTMAAVFACYDSAKSSTNIDISSLDI